MTRIRLWLLTAAAFLLTGGLYAAFQSTTPAPDLANWAPGGALLSIEARDFASLLHNWTAGPEEAAWLRSDDYAVFSRSHLFGRLQDAQKEFATAAGLPVDTALLQQLAGRQTFFAWYDIGQLQVLYITRLAPGTAAQNPLLTHRSQFRTRQAGGITFYVKTTSPEDTDGTATDLSSQAENPATNLSSRPEHPSTELSSRPERSAVERPAAETNDNADTTTTDNTADDTTTTPRTVAFAVSGDYLILATDEDLIAHTLELLAAKPTDDIAATALAHQPWYLDARTKAPANAGDLRMTLHLEAIVKTPQFRSYWVQQNITEMAQYQAAVADLYRGPTGFREERVLIPKPGSDTGAEADLAPLTALVPAHTVIYRAAAHPSTEDALATLDEKLLTHAPGAATDTTTAPTTDLSTPQPGTATDLETRIDEPAIATAAAAQNQLLHALLTTAPLDALMTLDRNGAQTAANTLWTPFASAVVLHSTQPWDAKTLQLALTQALQSHRTAAALGVTWQQHTAAGQIYFSTSEAAPLLLAIRGQTCILTDDEPFLLDILQNPQSTLATKPQTALLLAGFDHTAAQPAFAQWTATVDGLHQPAPTNAPAQTDTSPGQSPAFFAANLQSLSQSFATMTHETFTAHHDGNLIHQTVTYTFKTGIRD